VGPRLAVLAIDTASPAPAVALETDAGGFEQALPPDRRASEALLPAIRDLAERAGVPLASLTRITVCSGPGSFTGIRIGLATAWGLSRALSVAVESVSTLEAMAQAAGGKEGEEIVALLDAGRGDLAGQRFRRDGARGRVVPIGEIRRFPAAEAAAFAAGARAVALPAGVWDRAAVPEIAPARALARAVLAAPGKDAQELSAIYARASAAEEKHGAAPA
jgi:tRNA threonylcarbamoyladenosine biosynthesis protein TsaB